MSAPRLLREVLCHRLPDKQEEFLRKLLGREDGVNHGARSAMLVEAQRLLEELDEFAAWAEGQLRGTCVARRAVHVVAAISPDATARLRFGARDSQ